MKIDRFERALERWGDRLREKVFTPQELSSCRQKTNPGRHLALRFSAKEAFLKALGIGMAHGIAWKDMEVTNAPSGRPQLMIRGEAARICEEKGIQGVFVSISHEEGYGVSHVVLEV